MTVGFTSALNASSLSNVTSSSGHSDSTTLPWRNSNFVSKENATTLGTMVEPSSQHDSRVPATNSNGDYVTTIVGSYVLTDVYDSRFTKNGVLTLVPATTYIRTEFYTEVTAAHYGSVKSVNSSTTAEIWDRDPFETCEYAGFTSTPSLCYTAWPSFTSYGREPACTAAYSSFLATGSFITDIFTSVTSSTLPNGQTTVGIAYSSWVRPPGSPCCDNCTLIFQSLQMLYWPGSHPQTSCHTTSSSIANNDLALLTRSSGQRQGDNGTHDQPLYATGIDGYILSVPKEPLSC